jgi:heterodisulfide reductase subunit C
MNALHEKLSADVRIWEGLIACISCGTCTAVCPAAQFTDYDPRVIVETVQRRDEKLLVQLLSEDHIWWCGECLSCKTRCPRGNTPGYIIQSLRALSIETGLFAFSDQGLKQVIVKRSVGEDMLKYGYCVHIDEVNNEIYPEQGPVWEWYRNNRERVLERMGANYNGEGSGTLRRISPGALADLQRIFEITGAIQRFNRIEKSINGE